MREKLTVKWTDSGGCELHTSAGHLFLDAECVAKFEQSVRERKKVTTKEHVDAVLGADS